MAATPLVNQLLVELQEQPVCHPHYARSEELGGEITELCGYIYAATYQLLLKIREFDQQGLWKLDGICSCAHRLNYRCGIGMNAAREKVRVANALGDLPKISASFEKGELSYSKVRAMTRVAMPDNEDFLLNIAHHGSAHHMESLVSRYSRVKRLHKREVADEQYQDRSLKYYYDDDGSFVIKGRFPAEQGALILKALQMAVEQKKVPVARGSADVTAETPGRDVTAETSGLDVTAETREPFSTRRADALAEIAESYLASGPGSSSSADRYQVMLHVSAATLKDDITKSDITAETSHPMDEQISHIDDGPHVSADMLIRLSSGPTTSCVSNAP